MGQKFQYDESGSTFFYFLLSFLALVLVPATVYYWPRKRKIDPEEEQKKCQCPLCIVKREHLKHAEPWRGPKNLMVKGLIVVGWVLLLLLAYKVSQFDYEMSNFDPYEILGVPVSASSGDIKKAYRKLSLILHPDKDTGNEREFMKLTKAYQALTDDEARKNWEQYGNPDGPGATSFGIALPSWIVEKENSVWVLGLYALVFMVALPIVVGTWWYRSIRFTGDQVLLETLQMYYYFFHKTPNMPLKRVIMILAASLEFDKKNNSEVTERQSDNVEVPQLIKKLPNLNEKNKEIPLCYLYSIKARALIHAHLARIPLNASTLELDRRYVIGKCPDLLQEQVNTVNQLILLAYARRIQRLPTISSIENCMKLCPMIVQGLSEFKSPLLQLPHINEDNLKYFTSKKRQLSLVQYAQMKGDERRSVLRNLSDDEYDNVMKVLGNMPYIDFQVRCEVQDDENSSEVTAGAIVTVTVELKRYNMSEIFGDDQPGKEEVEEENNDEDKDEDAPNKRPVWMKRKKAGGKKKKPTPKAGKNKTKPEESPVPSSAATANGTDKREGKTQREKKDEEDSDSESDLSDLEQNPNNAGDGGDKSLESSDEDESGPKSNNEDDDQEWEKLRRMHARDKALEGRSKVSHHVHCPLFPYEKQEFWWTYICDRKSQTLLTAPYHVTNLVDDSIVELRFTAPKWKGVYTFSVWLRSDSYIGFDQQREIKLDVKEAPAEVMEHPQWEFEDSEEEDKKELEAQDSEYVTDEDLPEDED